MSRKLKYLSILMILIVLINSAISFFENITFAKQSISTDIDGIDDTKYPGIKSLIQELQKEHPNWNFKILYTGLDWEDVIEGETATHGTNVVSKSVYSGDWICSTCGTSKKYSGGSWYCASDSAVEYMMDPRNSLNDTDIFQFLELSYDTSVTYSSSALKSLLSGTFLDDGNLDTYISKIISSCKTYDVNPYYIVVKIIQEQGTNGGSTFKMLGESDTGDYKLDEENQVLTVLPGTTVKDISTYLEKTYTIKNASGEKITSTSAKVATGYTVDDKYTIVVLGDVNGDGQVKATDYMTIKNYILKKSELTTYQKLAADVNEDDKIKATDYMTIKNYILGKSSLTLKGEIYYYNIFNIGASGSTTSAIVSNALARAKSEGWTSIEECLDGGIKFISEGYISIGQDTMYFEKFNVVDTTEKYSYYTHQYAQDLIYAQNQGTKLRSVLSSIKALDYEYTFVIPVYENMPESACARPSTK